MTPSVVCDASTLVAAFVDAGPDGAWALEQLRRADLQAPSLIDFEAANVFRRHAAAGLIDAGLATRAHGRLVRATIRRWPYSLLAERTWELRDNLTVFDASYVAVAELTGAPLMTLDSRLMRAPGIRCEVVAP